MNLQKATKAEISSVAKMRNKSFLKPLAVNGSVFLALFFSVNVFGQNNGVQANYLITPKSVAGITIGANVGQARKFLKGTSFLRVEGEGMEIVDVQLNQKTLMYFYLEPNEDDAPANESTNIESIEVVDSRYRTSEGIHCGMKTSEVEKIYGKMRELVVNDYDESENMTFSDQPENYQFTVEKSGDSYIIIKISVSDPAYQPDLAE